jgi:hypothetical protein
MQLVNVNNQLAIRKVTQLLLSRGDLLELDTLQLRLQTAVLSLLFRAEPNSSRKQCERRKHQTDKPFVRI